MDCSTLVLPSSTALEWRLPPLKRLLAQSHPIDTLLCGIAYKPFRDICAAEILYKLTSTKPNHFFLLELSAFYTSRLINRCVDDGLAAELRFAYECFLLGLIEADTDCGLHAKTLVVMIDGCSERIAPHWADVIRQVCTRASPTIENLLFVDGMTNACCPLRIDQDGTESYKRWTIIRKGLFDCLRLLEIIIRMARLSSLQVPNLKALLGDARPQSREAEPQWQHKVNAAWAQFSCPDEQLDRAQNLQFLEVDEVYVNLLPTNVFAAQNFFGNVKVFRFRQVVLPAETTREFWQPYYDFQKRLTQLRGIMPYAQFQTVFPPAMFFLYLNVRVEDYVNGLTMLHRDVPQNILTNVDVDALHSWLYVQLQQIDIGNEDELVILRADRRGRRYFRANLHPSNNVWFSFGQFTGNLYARSNRIIIEGASPTWRWEELCELLNDFYRDWSCRAETKRRLILRITDGNRNKSLASSCSCNCRNRSEQYFLAAVIDLLTEWQQQARECRRDYADFCRRLDISNFHVDLVMHKRENETLFEFGERIEYTTSAAKLVAHEQRLAYERDHHVGDERSVMLLFSRLRVVAKN